MKLFGRFFLILLGFAMVPVLGMGLWMITSVRAVRGNTRALHGRLALLTAELADHTLKQLNRDLIVVEDLQRARGKTALEEALLRRAAASDSAIAWIALIDSSGRAISPLADPELFPDPSSAPAISEIAQAQRTGQLVLGAPLALHGATLLPAVHPLGDGRCLVLIYSLRDLGRRLKELSHGGPGRLLFVDATGRPLQGVGDDPPSRDWSLPENNDERSWDDQVPGQGGPWVAASSPVPALGWRAVSLQSRREAYAEDQSAAVRAVFFFLALCLLTGLGAYGLSRRLLRPIQALIGGAQRVESGDFSRPVPRLGWGELELLGSTFNSMAETMRRWRELHVERVLEEKARVDALVRHIPDGILLAGFDGTVLYVNAAAARVLGAKIAVGGRMEDAVRFPELRGLLAGARAGSAETESASVEITTGEPGAEETYLCRLKPITRDRRQAGLLLLMRNVTLERQIERMKNELFHALVHDLRSPLTVIDGMIHMVRRQAADERVSRYVGLAEQALQRLNGLVADILDLAKLESGTMPFAPAATRASILLRSAFSACQVPAETKGVALKLEGDADFPLVCDGPLIERVLINLAGNAVKFTPSEGRVCLGAAVRGAELEFFVQDTGPGIPPDKLDAVFEKFTQLTRDIPARAGYGLGLSICRRIVDLHGGRIWAESQEGKGSRFVFRIPSRA